MYNGAAFSNHSTCKSCKVTEILGTHQTLTKQNSFASEATGLFISLESFKEISAGQVGADAEQVHFILQLVGKADDVGMREVAIAAN
jgi:hypothetical protein